MEKDYFINTIKEQYSIHGNALYEINNKFITDNMTSSNEKITPINISNIERGKFYLMYYDLSGKSSMMEKINPIFIIDWFDINNTRTLYAVSTNFIPISIRTIFFNNIINFNLDIIEKNKEKDINNELPFDNINFYNIYKLLFSIGFEWAIRKFDYKLINKIYTISSDILPEFITMSTARIIGVDDGKLIEIWQKKISEQDQRKQKMISELLGDYNKLNKSINDSYLTLDKRANNIEKSLQIIKKFK